MRDGSGNKLSPEEVQKVKSIQGVPDKDSVSGISIKPDAGKDRGTADKPQSKPGEKPAAGVEE
jgi:hypothetical protein